MYCICKAKQVVLHQSRDGGVGGRKADVMKPKVIAYYRPTQRGLIVNDRDRWRAGAGMEVITRVR